MNKRWRMYVQDPNETRSGRLELSWVEVHGHDRTHLEARWTVVPRPVTGGTVQAA